ncbi:MAG: hypothetical protein OXF23_05140 [Candidatus Dadabacteria bacterium]|nr:hypothetical protein [Candidatus Dadabacteria bacterium]
MLDATNDSSSFGAVSSSLVENLPFEVPSGEPFEGEIFQRELSLTWQPYIVKVSVSVERDSEEMPSSLKSMEGKYTRFTQLLCRASLVFLAFGVIATVSVYWWNDFWAKFLGPQFFAFAAVCFLWGGHRANRENASD